MKCKCCGKEGGRFEYLDKLYCKKCLEKQWQDECFECGRRIERTYRIDSQVLCFQCFCEKTERYRYSWSEEE